MRLIPAIDLRGGRCVRLFQGDFAAETRYETKPLALLRHYKGFGAHWVHIVDLDGARDGEGLNQPVIAELAQEPGVQLQVGGGIRTRANAQALFDRAVARVVFGSSAVETPAIVSAALAEFGAERICVALDVRIDASGTPLVQTRGWRANSALSLWDALALYAGTSLRHVLCTDIARDGALTGPNVELYRDACARYPGLAWQASGGVRSAADLDALRTAGAAAAVSGKALLERRISPEELQPFLPNASSPASTSATVRS